MPDYVKRPAELITSIDEINLQLPEQERARLRQGLTDYLNARKAALDDLGKLLDNMNPGNQEEPWVRRVEQAQADLNQHIGNSLNGIDAGVLALTYRAITLMDEHEFWAGLKDVKVAEKRDRIAELRQKLEQMAAELDKKWQAIESADGSYDQRQENVINEVQYQLQLAIEKVAEKRRVLKEKIANLPVMLSDWPKHVPGGAAGRLAAEGVKKAISYAGTEMQKQLSFALGEMKDSIKLWLRTNEEFLKRIGAYRELMQSEVGGVLVLFSQTHQDTQTFVKDNGFDKAKALYQEAHDALARWSSNLDDGASDDADAFAEYALEQLSWILARTEATFNDFVRRHQYKFFGPVGPDIRETLTEEKAWEQRVRGLKTRDLETALREFRDEAKTFFSVDLEGPISRNIDELRLREDLRNSGEDRAVIQLYEGYAAEMRKGLEEQVEALVKAAEESLRQWSPEEFDEAFKRTLVVDALPD